MVLVSLLHFGYTDVLVSASCLSFPFCFWSLFLGPLFQRVGLLVCISVLTNLGLKRKM